MSLRWRITGALVLLVAAAVAAGTASHLSEVSRQLEASLEQQGSRVVASIRTELEVSAQTLDEELRLALRPGVLDRWLGRGGQGRYLGARDRLQAGRLELLKVLGPQGTILTSGHWPSSFGALDPLFGVYVTDPGPVARIVDEATPDGSSPSLQRWARAKWGSQTVFVVAGRFLDEAGLERTRATVGADLLALCRGPVGMSGPTTCLTVGAADVLDDVPFAPHDERWLKRYHLEPLSLGRQRGGSSYLVAGVDRASLEAVRVGIVQRALTVGGASLVLALLLGFFLATRITKPIEALARAAETLAEGDLQVRVQVARDEGGREVRRLVDTFNQMAVQIERSQRRLVQAERVAAWREIARGLAHELKNPLTPIRGAMDVIRKAHKLGRPDFGEILDEQAEAVVEEVGRLKELSDAFARFARLPDPRPEPLLLAKLLDNAVALYAGDDTEVEVRRVYGDVPEVRADRTQLQTAITNLIKNAVEAMEQKGRLTLRLTSVERGTCVDLVVEDSGPGIAEEIQERLFTPYVTTKGSRGTGLGLALVHRIVAEHGGSIEVGTAEDGGAAFQIRLPIEGPPDPPEQTQPPTAVD